MLTIHLTEEIEQQLEDFAATLGRTKVSFAEEAIIEYLTDRIDVAVAEHRLLELREGRSSTMSLEDFMKKHGLDD